MSVALGLLAFFIILATLVLAHELGHFSFARLLGVKVEEFGLGFPPRVKTWRRGGTIYSINAVPLGGFVRMLGENGRQDDPASFGAQPPWKRFCILFAGPAVNVLLAIVILTLVNVHGSDRYLTVVSKVAPGSPAARAGLQPGDQIVSFNGSSTRYFDQFSSAEDAHMGERVTLGILRGRRNLEARVMIRANPPAGQGPIGIVRDITKKQVIAYAPPAAVARATGDVFDMATTIPRVVTTLFASNSGTGVVGPIGIAHITTAVAQDKQDPVTGLIQLAALLSANLGILNLLPFPALDGGRIVFVAISAVRRRNLSPEVEGLIHLAGMAVLLTLIVWVSYNDLVRWITGG